MKKKIILAVLTLIIIVGGILFATRSNKQEFISYIIKDDIWNILDETYIEKYQEKQKEASYTNKGQFSLTTNGLKEQTLGLIQDINLSFEGKVNNSEKKSEENITIGTEKSTTIKYRQDNQKFGIQTELLGTKFVAIENENLKQLAEKFGFEAQSIPNKIEVEDTGFTEKELKTLRNKYLKILNKYITKDQFSKEKVEGQTVVELSITEQEITEIAKNILQELRNDEIILNEISEENMKTEIQNEIDAIITDLDSLEINPNNKCIIKLYVKLNDVKKYEIIFEEGDREISKTTIENTDTQITITTYQDDNLILEGNLTKRKEQKDVIYDIAIKAYIEGQKTELILKTQYKNLLELDNVEEIHEIKVSYEDQNQYGNLENTSDQMDININYSNQKKFESNIEIEGLNEENTILLNTATNEELQSIILAIYISLGLI